MQLVRKIVKANAAWQRFAASGKVGFAADFVFDAVLMPSPYASSFGGFVNLHTSLWFGGGGMLSSALNSLAARRSPETARRCPRT